MITEEDLMDLPEDPSLAFVMLEDKIRRMTNEQINEAGQDASWGPYYIQYI